MKITRRQLKQIIVESLNENTKNELVNTVRLMTEDDDLDAEAEKEVSPSIQEKFESAKKIPANKLRVSETGIKEIKRGEAYRPRIYDDKLKTSETSGPWIISLGWDPWTGEKVKEDPRSGRMGANMGGENFDIVSFAGTARMSKTDGKPAGERGGVPTIGYGIALNSSERVRNYAHHLGDDPSTKGEQWVIPAAEHIDTEEESWQGGNENRVRRDMTMAEADELLRSKVEGPAYAAGVRRQLGSTPITQDQFDALVSRAWNEGSGGATIIAAADNLKKGTPEGWLAAADAGRFSEDGSRQRREKALMSSWSV
jgi:GH24 family phage-related lysozyme (muramidase)